MGTRGNSGFTLLEMVLVLFLMGMMASAALLLTEGVEDQAKYEETRRRMEMVRKAIVGDPTRTVNGGPEISGFVADLGRLPGCLAELLESGPEKMPVTDPRTFESPCDSTVTITEWHIDAGTGIASGWRGRYLQVLPERDGALRFRDGYGNSGDSETSDAQNSGWIYAVSGATVGLTSEGFDLIDTGDDVSAEPLVAGPDWQIQLPATINVTLNNRSGTDLPSSGPQDLVLLIYGDDLNTPFGASEVLTLAANEVPAHGKTSRDFILPVEHPVTGAAQTVPMGRRGYVIACDKWDHDSNSGTPDVHTSFLSSGCDTQQIDAAAIRTFTVAPRQNIALDWFIQ